MNVISVPGQTAVDGTEDILTVGATPVEMTIVRKLEFTVDAEVQTALLVSTQETISPFAKDAFE